MTTGLLLLAGLVFILAALAHGGVYTIVVAGAGAGASSEYIGHTEVHAYRVNRFTGSVVFCDGFRCMDVRWAP